MKAAAITRPWLIVAGDVTPLGGMDAANHALVRHLAEAGTEIHVVAHRVWPDLRGLPALTVHDVWRPFGRHVLGSPILSQAGHRVWRRGIAPRGGCVVVNGGNCAIAGVNWVHYVHAAHAPTLRSTMSRQAQAWLAHRRDVAAERAALGSARLVICNSRRTERDVIERVGVDPTRVRVVYYGSDPDRFGAVSASQRAAARRALGRSADRPLVGFIGALGDRRKAFDTLFDCWTSLCRRASWDADLIVVGTGAELDRWRQRAKARRLEDRVVFLGFRSDVPEILAALDGVVHPARYEAYGLSVHEALCRGVPALVTASSGVAERYPPELGGLLIDDPDDPAELEERLWLWRRDMESYRARVASVSETLRQRSWGAMSQEIVELVERAA